MGGGGGGGRVLRYCLPSGGREAGRGQDPQRDGEAEHPEADGRENAPRGTGVRGGQQLIRGVGHRKRHLPFGGQRGGRSGALRL